MASRQSLWINEINYFGTTGDFVEIAVPTDHNLRAGFTIVIYSTAGAVLETIATPSLSSPGSAFNQIQYVKLPITDLPDGGFGVALVREDGSLAEFLSFGPSGLPVTAVAGPANGASSTAITTQDTNSTRSIGLTGSAAGPDGWSWTTNIAIAGPAARNPGQTHTPTSTGNGVGNAGANTLVGTGAANTLDGSGGNDILFGLAGNNTLIGGDNNDVLVGGTGSDALQGGSGLDTASYDTAVAAVTVNLATNVHTGEAAGDTFNSIEAYELTNFNDTFVGDGNGNTVAAGAGNDTINAGLGNDSIDGGAGFDTALFGVQPGPADVAWNGSSWTVTTSDGVDTVVNVEFLDDGGGARTLLVGGGGFASIGAAITAANPGDLILIAPGTYAENVVVNKSVTLVGMGDGDDVTIQGTFETDNAIGGGDVHQFLFTAPGYNTGAGIGVTVSANNVSISNLVVDGFYTAVEASGSVSGLTLNDVTMQDGVNGFRKGNATAVSDLSINGGAFRDLYIGVYLTADVGSAQDATDITIDGTTFEDLTQKGIYAETLQGTTLFANLSMSNVGELGRGDSFISGEEDGAFGNGIDINLKWHTYVGSITIEDFNFNGVGSSTGGGLNPTGHLGGAAIGIKGRDDAPSYSGDPADVSGLTVTIRNGVIDGTSTGIRAGEPGKSNVGPAITIENVEITNHFSNGLHDQIDNRTQSVMTVSGDSGVDVYHAPPASTGSIDFDGQGGADNFAGGGGADNFTGGEGNDTLTGGAGIDTANYNGSIEDFAGLFGVSTVTVTDQNAGDGDEGADTLSGIEVVQFADARVLIVGAGSAFTTIQSAVNAAEDGDTIVIQSGTYVEQVVVSGFTNLTIAAGDGQDVNIVAPADVTNTVTSSSGRALNGVVTVINSTNVTLYGLDVDGAGAGNTVDGTNANFVGVVYRNSSGEVGNVDITGVHDAYPGGTTADGYPVQSGNQRGVGLQVDNDTLMNFTMYGGSIADFQKNATVFNRANLDVSGVTVTGGGAQTINAQNGFQALNSTGAIYNNIISAIGYAGPANAYSAGILLFDNGLLSITGNTITGTNGATLNAKVVGVYVFNVSGDNLGSTISNNNISHVDTGIGVYDDNLGAVVISNNSITNVDTTDPYAAGVDLQPSSGGPFTATGSDFGDILVGAGGADVLDGGLGADYLQGNGGNDSLTGGGGDDVAAYAGDRADYTVVTSTDVNGFVTGFVSVTDNNVGDGDDGVDSLYFVEALEFGDVTLSVSDPIQLFDNGGDLVGTFTTIQAAIDAASEGGTVLISDGDYAGDLTIPNGLGITLEGIGDVNIAGQISSSGELNGTLTFRNLDIDATGENYGIFATNNSTGMAGEIVLDSVDISGAANNGFAYVRAGNGTTPTLADTIGAVEILNSNFSSNGTVIAGGGGRGEVLLFGFNGDLTIDGSSFTGAAGAQKAIQLRGIQTGSDVAGVGPYAPAGDFSLTNSSVGGTYLQDAIAIYRIADFDSFTMTNVVANVSAPWGVFNPDSVGGVIDASGLSGVNIGGAGLLATLQGLSSADTFTGTSGSDTLNGRGGADSLTGGDGNDLYFADASDTIVENANEGTDSVQSSESHTLADNVENLTLVDGPTVNPSGTGNALGNVITGNNGANLLSGLGGADTLNGGGGSDTLAGGEGADALFGGAANDTASFAGVAADHTIAWNGSNFTVTDNNVGDGDEGTDTLTSVESVAFSDVTYRLVGGDGFATINAAIAAANPGDVILIAPGSYAENVSVNKSVTLVGMGDGDDVTIQGTFESSNGVSGDVNVYLRTTASYSGAAGSGLTVSANNVSISNLKVDSFLNGVEVTGASVSGLTLNDVTIEDSVFGIVKANNTLMTGLNVNGGTIRDGYIGVYFHNGAYPPTGQDAVDTTIDGLVFQDLTQKGIYAETLQGTTLFDNLVMTNVGQYGGGVAFSANGANGAGIDANLKFHTYTGSLTIEDFTFTDVGASTGTDGTGHQNAAGIAIKGRDDPGHSQYGTVPADVSGLSVTIRNGSIDGTSTGIRAGEAGKANSSLNVTGPAVTIENVDITDYLANSKHDQIDNRTHSTMTVNGTGGSDVYHAADTATSTGSIVFNGQGGADDFSGGAGADSFTGGEGNDGLEGGAGVDTAFFSGNADDYGILFGPLTVTDNNTGDGDDGTDTLSNIEIAAFADKRVLIVGVGSEFTTIQAAVNAAQDGDVILLQNAVYNGDVTISGGLEITIEGNGSTVVGQITSTGVLDGELVIQNLDINASGKQFGVWSDNTSTAYAGSIKLDNVSISNANHAGFYYAAPGNLSTPISNTNTVGDIQVLNSDFTNNGISVPAGNGRAHITIFGFNQDLTIDSSSFAGAPNTQKAMQLRGVGSGSDSPGVGPYLPSGNFTLSNLSITGAYLQDAIAVYDHASFASFALASVVANLSAPWGAFNADGVGGSLDLSGLSGSNSGGPLFGVLQGLGGSENFSGTGGADALLGRGGNDTLEGRGGNDLISGAGGSDTAVYSGDFADYTISFSAGAYTITDNRIGSPDGEDTVTDVEFFEFADQTVAAGDLGANVAPDSLTLSANTVPENNSGDVVVGNLSATDPNPSDDTFTYTLVSGAGSTDNGSFSIVGDQLVFTGSADFETQYSYSVRIRVTDEGGLWREEVKTVNVTDISEVPGATSPSTTIWLNEVSYFNLNPGVNPDFIEVAIPVEGKHKPLFQIAIYDGSGNLLDLIDSPANTNSANGIQYLRFDHFETPGGHLPDTGFAVALIRADGSVRQFLNFGLGASTVTALNGPAAGATSTAVTAVDDDDRSIGLTGTASGPDGWVWSENVALALTGRNPLQNHTPITNPTVTGDGNANIMIGTTAVNTLNGGAGNDALFGLAGNDTLNGDGDTDTLVGGQGADVLNGGAGTDTASYISATTGLTINLQTGVHTGDALGDTFTSIENFRLSEFNDIFTNSNASPLTGTTSGGMGNDTYFAGTSGTNRFNGNDGVDTFHGSSAASVFDGGAGADSAYGGSGVETLFGRDGNDYLYGGGGGDTIHGHGGSDTIIGGANNDSMDAGAADLAADTFIFNFGVNAGTNEGSDTILSFEDDIDKLDFSGASYGMADVSGNVHITLSTGTVITVVGITSADIADDIIVY